MVGDLPPFHLRTAIFDTRPPMARSRNGMLYATFWNRAAGIGRAQVRSHGQTQSPGTFCKWVRIQGFPHSLDLAQVLKEITAEEVCQQLSGLEERTSLSREQCALISLRRDELSKSPPLSNPFSEPYWWAGFLCSGI